MAGPRWTTAKQRKRRTAAMLAWLAAAALVAPAPAGAAAVERPRASDVNGDGVPDLVAASSARLTRWLDPARDPADLGGSVYILPGGPTGSRPAPALLNQDSHDSIGGESEKSDTFGQSVATGDFDGDGKADIALGNPHEEIGGMFDVGVVTVQYGQSTAPYVGRGRGGLTWIDQNATDIPGDNEPGDLFGTALATGYFNDDAFADLAVGAPGEAIGSAFEAGRVTVLYGSSTGLTATGAQTFDGTVAGAAEPFDHFGASLTAANLRGGSHDELAVLSSGEHLSGTAGAWGAAIVLTGADAGLTATELRIVNVGATGTSGHLRTVVAGRFHSSAYADLALFADQKRGAAPRSGAVVIAPIGSTAVGSAPYLLTSASPATDEYWGGALAAGDVNGDGFDELAVGALRGAGGKGSVTLYAGGPAKLTDPGHRAATFTEDTPAVAGTAKPGEGFGYALAIQDSTGDGIPELVVGAPWEDPSGSVAGTSTTGSVLYELGVIVPAAGPPVVTSSRTTRATSPSKFGPGGPGLAGGATMLTENGVEPYPWIDRLPPLS